MSVHVLLNLFNELRKKIQYEDISSFLSFHLDVFIMFIKYSLLHCPI